MTLQEFVAKYDGKMATFAGYSQCVAVAELYCQEVLQIPVVWANAIDWWQKDSSYLTWTANKWGDPNSKPNAGDIVVWGQNAHAGTGIYGHIAICTDSGDGNTFTTLDQNWPAGSVVKHVKHDYWGVIGWGDKPQQPASPAPAGIRTMYDSVTAADIPASAAIQLVAGYVDGLYAWSPTDLLRAHVQIAVSAATNAGNCLDVEQGDATPAEAVPWVQMRRAAGVDPSVYMNGNTWPAVKAAFQAAGVTEPHYWVAVWGSNQTIPEGAVALQYANPPLSGGHYDLSAVLPVWPGVDSVALPKVDPCADLKSQVNILGQQVTRVSADRDALAAKIADIQKRINQP